jgi:hypothetical protein
VSVSLFTLDRSIPETSVEMATRTIHGSELQQRLLRELRQFTDFRTAPDDLLRKMLDAVDIDVSPDDLEAAASAIYAEAYYGRSKDMDVTPEETRQLTRLTELMELTDEQVVAINYQVGLTVYKKRFRDLVADGELGEQDDRELGMVRDFFGLRKRDMHHAISQQALAFYSFLLADSLRDGVLSEDEMSELALMARKLGLTSKQLSSISVPNKKDILATALASIKARGEIRTEDREHICTLAEYLNATDDLLKPCLMDLDLYSKVFAIRAGELPEINSQNLILDRGEHLHYSVSTTYEVPSAGKIKRQGGTLYVGSRKLRFVGLRRSHEVRYANVLQVEFTLHKHSKLTIAVASGAGGGGYRLKHTRDPGQVVELQEAIRFLIRKAKGLEVKRGRDTRYISADARSEVWYRDGGRCVICGATEYLEFDHIIPFSKGGATSVENLQLLCRKCNSEKSDSI